MSKQVEVPEFDAALRWPFPTFRVRRRPFDFATDQADIPVEIPAPTPYPEQARLDLYLRAPEAVVRR